MTVQEGAAASRREEAEAFVTTGGPLLATKGSLSVRLATTVEEISAAQHLRYRVFYEELAATPDETARTSRLDSDAFDAICDHLLVVSKGEPAAAQAIEVEDGELVGTYRLLRQNVANRHGGFYTEDEFDVVPLIARKRGLNFLELGRSCVLKPYRVRPVIELLWQGIWNYVRIYDLDVMLGCASFEGTDPDKHALPLSFMAQHCAAPPEWRVRALPHRYVDMNRLPREQIVPKLPASDPLNLNDAAPKIREILIQEKINQMLNSWLQTLRSQAQIQVLSQDKSSDLQPSPEGTR